MSAQCPHNVHTMSAQRPHNVGTMSALCLHNISRRIYVGTMSAQFPHNVRTMSSQCPHYILLQGNFVVGTTQNYHFFDTAPYLNLTHRGGWTKSFPSDASLFKRPLPREAAQISAQHRHEYKRLIL